jgi:hypothetical protein
MGPIQDSGTLLDSRRAAAPLWRDHVRCSAPGQQHDTPPSGSLAAVVDRRRAGLEDPLAGRRDRRESILRVVWPLSVVGAVLLANVLGLSGVVDVDPLGPIGHTALHVGSSLLPGANFVDREAGWTAQSLGRLVAEDWLHGIVPWWNPFEGLGAPLAAEMQAGAFFPPTLLLALPQGQLFFHVLLESTAGLGTFFLTRELGFGRGIAAFGGMLFALDGTFSIFGHAPANPVAFLPFMLLGVERLHRREAPDHTGWLVLATSVALSVYAGFPETAYLDGLLVLFWFLLRLAGRPAPGRARFALQAGLGAGVGVLLAAPVIVAFAEYLPIADVGMHAGGDTFAHVPAAGAAMIGLPWVFGPIGAFAGPSTSTLTQIVGETGGYVTASAIAMAGIGLLCGRGERGLRIFLAATVLVALLWTYGLRPVQVLLVHVIPLAGDVWVAHYAAPTWELGFVLLACYGADALVSPLVPGGRRLRALGGPALALAVVALDLALGQPVLRSIGRAAPSSRPYAIVATCWAVGTLAALAAAVVVTGRRPAGEPGYGRAARIAGRCAVGLVAVDALLTFAVPQLSAPSSVVLDTGPVAFLESHLGDGRFFSIGVYLPNYGSYFGLASADSNDLPVPAAWSRYVDEHLSSNVSATFFGTRTIDPEPTATEQLLARLPAYEAIDVRYVLLPTGRPVFGSAGMLAGGMNEVYSDSLVTIYALPHPRPFFSTSGSACRLASDGLARVVARCAAPATLVRAELEMPGWTATVDGRSVPVRTFRGGLESVRLPAGTSSVAFAYSPAHMDLGLGLVGLGGLTMLGVPVAHRLRRRRRAPVKGDGSPDGLSSVSLIPSASRCSRATFSSRCFGST